MSVACAHFFAIVWTFKICLVLFLATVPDYDTVTCYVMSCTCNGKVTGCIPSTRGQS